MPSPIPTLDGPSRIEYFALAGLTLAAFALRLSHLDHFLLWEDEGATWWYSRLITEGRLMEGIRLEPTPPLYYLLVAAVTAILGSSDWAMRFPSVVIGAVSIPVLLLLVRSVARSLRPRVVRIAAWVAAVLLAIHPLHVFYSREARVYPLLLLLTMLLWLSLRRALEDDHGRSWFCVATLLLIIAYSHYYSLFLFATAGLLIWMLAKGTRCRWRGLAAVTVSGLLFLPYVILTLPHLRDSGAAWSIEALYAALPAERSFGRVLEMGMIGADYPVYLREIAFPPTASWLRWSAIAVHVVLLALGVRRFLVPDAGPRRDLAFWLVAWLSPLLLPWAVTHSFRAIFHPGRHDVYSLWGLLFGVSVGMAALLTARHRLWLAAALAGLLLLFAGAGRLALLHATQPKLAVGERAAWIAPHLPGPNVAAADSGVRIWTLGVRRLLAERYLRLARPARGDIPISSFPASTDTHPGWSDARALMKDREAILAKARRRVAELDPAVERVFVLPAGPPPAADGGMTAQGFIDAALMRSLEGAGWRIDPELSRPDLELLAYTRPTS